MEQESWNNNSAYLKLNSEGKRQEEWETWNGNFYFRIHQKLKNEQDKKYKSTNQKYKLTHNFSHTHIYHHQYRHTYHDTRNWQR